MEQVVWERTAGKPSILRKSTFINQKNSKHYNVVVAEFNVKYKENASLLEKQPGQLAPSTPENNLTAVEMYFSIAE